jgi:hypothetical protein
VTIMGRSETDPSAVGNGRAREGDALPVGQRIPFSQASVTVQSAGTRTAARPVSISIFFQSLAGTAGRGSGQNRAVVKQGRCRANAELKRSAKAAGALASA